MFVKTFPLSHGPSVGMAWHQANCSSVKIVIAGLERVLLRCNAAVMEHFVGEEQVVLSLRVQQQIDFANVCNVCETVPGLVLYNRLHYCFLPNSIFCPTLGGATHSAPLLAVLPWQRAPKSSVCRGDRGWKSVIWGDGGKHVFFSGYCFFWVISQHAAPIERIGWLPLSPPHCDFQWLFIKNRSMRHLGFSQRWPVALHFYESSRVSSNGPRDFCLVHACRPQIMNACMNQLPVDHW